MRQMSIAEYAEKYGDRTVIPERTGSLTESEASDLTLPRRTPQTHKYSYGRALVIAGSRGFSGAPVLAANACERSGAGLTTLMVPDSIYGIAASRCDGSVVTLLPSNQNGSIAKTALYVILSALEKAGACVIGPGLRVNDDTADRKSVV